MARGLIAALVAVACCAAAATAAAQPRDTKALRVKLQRQLVDGMKDPASVQLRATFLSASEGDGAVVSLCGEVNAKNSYGGYVGFSGFISTSEGQVIIEASEPPGSFGHVWPVWCGRRLGGK